VKIVPFYTLPQFDCVHTFFIESNKYRDAIPNKKVINRFTHIFTMLSHMFFDVQSIYINMLRLEPYTVAYDPRDN
jgi:hypothetical protein